MTDDMERAEKQHAVDRLQSRRRMRGSLQEQEGQEYKANFALLCLESDACVEWLMFCFML